MENSVRKEKWIRFSMVMAFIGFFFIAGLIQARAASPNISFEKDLKLSGLCQGGSSDGYSLTLNGVPFPATIDVAHGGKFEISLNINLAHVPFNRNEYPEFLKYVQIKAGSCWKELSPQSGHGLMTADQGSGMGVWAASVNKNLMQWEFLHPEAGNVSGDGDLLGSGYRCVPFTFSFTGTLDETCAAADGLQFDIVLEGDGADKGLKRYNSGIHIQKNANNSLSREGTVGISNIRITSPSPGMLGLSWDYASTFIPSEFIIEHSFDGEYFKEVMRFNPGAADMGGNTFTTFFTDETQKRTFYRVRVADGQNGAVLSPLAFFDNSPKESFSLNYVKPNPSSEHAEISFTSNDESFTEVQVQDQNGKILYNETVYARPGANEVKVQTEAWDPGMYFVFLQKGSETLTSRLIHQ